MYKLIQEAYYDPSIGYQSATKLFHKLKSKGVTLEQIKQFLSKQESTQLHKQPIRVKNYFPIVAKYENEILQVDLADFSDISTTNDNYKWLLCAIDVFTRKSYVIPLKNKTSVTVTHAMSKIIENEKPSIINCDKGSEFISKEFKKLMNDNNIEIRYVEVGDHHKLGIVDRFIRTLRSLINRYQTAYKTTRFINVLNKLVNNYNNSYHTGIRGIPNEVNEIKLTRLNNKKYNNALKEEIKFNINDSVRYLKNKVLFEKGSQPNWSTTIYKIIDMTEHMYKLDNGKWYKYYQLQKVNEPMIYKKETRLKQPTQQEIRKDNSSQRKLNKEGVSTENIIKTKRIRQATDRLHY